MKRTSLTLGFLLVSTALVHAQSDAETAWEAIFKDINQSGWLSATVGTVHHNDSSDALTLENLVYDYSITLDPDKAMAPSEGEEVSDESNEFTIKAKIRMPVVTFKGLQLKDAGYSYDSMTMQGTHISLMIDEKGTANDATIEVETVGKDVITKGYQPFFGEYKIAPARPIGSTLDYIRPLLLNSLCESMTSEGVRMEQFVKGQKEPIQTTVMGPFSLSGIANGKLESYEISSQTSNTKMVLPDESETEKAPSAFPTSLSYTIGKTTYKGYDFGAFWSAIDPNAPKIEGTKKILEKTEMEGATITIPDMADIKVGPSVQSDITVKQPKSYLVPLLDKLFVEQGLKADDIPQEDQQALVEAGFDLVRSFAMGLTQVGKTDAEVTLPEGPYRGQKATFGFDSIRQAGFSSDGIEESSISGVSYAGPQAMNFKLGRLAIEDLEFADYHLIKQAIINAMQGHPPKGSEAVKLGPDALTVALEDLAYEDNNGSALSANEINLHYDRMGLSIPAEVSTKIDNLKIAKSMLRHPLASVFLDQLGLDTLTINEELAMNWNDESQTFEISPINLELPNIVSLSGSLGAGGIMRDYLESPETAQAAMATATVLPASLKLKDLGGLDELINLAGGAMGMGPEQMRDMAAMQLRAVLSGFTEPAFYESVLAQVDTFLKDPQSLMVSLNPSNPVPVAQLLGVAATAPQQIPNLLAIGVVANDN